MRGELRASITTDALELGIDIGELDAARGRHVPGHGRLAAPDVGAGGPARPRPGGVRRRRGRARPVLLPPPRRVPRPPGRGGDPRPREPADLPRAPALRRPRGAAVARRRGVPRPALGGARRAARERRRAAPPAGHGAARSYVPRRAGGYPAAEVSLRSASPESFAIVDVSSGELLGTTEAARAHSTVHEGADLHAPRALLRGARARPRAPARARLAVRRRLVHAAQARRPTRRSCACSTAARRSA